MSDIEDLGQRAERLQKKRTRVVLTATGLFVLLQGAAFNSWERADAILGRTGGSLEALRNLDRVRLGAYVLWLVVLLMLLITGGGYIHGRKVREMLADEVTLAHRRSAYMWGYWSLMLTSAGVFVLGVLQPLNLMEIVHTLLSVGVVVPLLRFAWLERQSERG